MADGSTAIVCSTQRTQHCGCGKRARYLCDGPQNDQTPKGETTCSRPLCADHAVPIGGDEHLCEQCRIGWRADIAREAAFASIGLDEEAMADLRSRDPRRRHASIVANEARCECGALGIRRCCYQVQGGKRPCGAPLCDRCAVPVGPRREQCPGHPR
jgi:hypothetical protein